MYIIRKNIFNKENKLFDVDRGDAFVLTKLTMLRGKYISSAVQKEEKTKQFSDIRFTNIQDVNCIFIYLNFFSRV